MLNDFPSEPTIVDGKATLQWINDCGEEIKIILDMEPGENIPATIRARTSFKKAAISLPIHIHHSDSLIPCELTPLMLKVPGLDWPVMIVGVDGKKYLLQADEAKFIEHACRILVELSKLKKQ